jgi:endoglucanase
VLRIPITPTYDENLVTQVIGFARSHGMKVILDLHNDQAKDWAAGYLGSDAWINFWKNMATKYKGNPDVIAFELFNEAFFTGTWNSSIQTNIDVFAKAFARCTDAIRQIDPTRAVIWSDPYAGNILPYKDWINSPYPASLLESLRPYTNNMYFAFHDYPPIDPISGKDWTGIQKFLEAMAYVKQHGFNVWLGEFGPDNYGASTPFSIDEERQFVLRCINYCIDNNIGFSLWEYRNNHYMTNLGYPNFYDEVLTQSKYVP